VIYRVVTAGCDLPDDVVQVREPIDLPGRPDVQLPVAAVGATDERGVDARVLGGAHVGLVVADEQRVAGVEVAERLFDVVGVRLTELERVGL